MGNTQAMWGERLIVLGLLAAIVLMGSGTAWDIYWHAAVGRDTFWIPPHIIVYSGAVLSGALALLFVLWKAMEFSHSVTVSIRFSLTQGYGMAGVGSLVITVAAVFDDIWHRTIGDRTIWSPPHVMGVIGAIIVVFGTLTALLHAQRRLVLCPRLSGGSITLLLAAVVLAAYYGLIPVSLMAFRPEIGLRFVITSPFIFAGLASLMLSAVAACTQQLVGRGRIQVVVIVAAGLWGIQQVAQSLVTPPVAMALGYAMRQYVLPDLPFAVLILGLVLVPMLAAGYLSIPQPWITGALMGILYTAEVAVWLYARGTMQAPWFSIPVVAALGAASAVCGDRFGRGVLNSLRGS